MQYCRCFIGCSVFRLRSLLILHSIWTLPSSYTVRAVCYLQVSNHFHNLLIRKASFRKTFPTSARGRVQRVGGGGGIQPSPYNLMMVMMTNSCACLWFIVQSAQGNRDADIVRKYVMFVTSIKRQHTCYGLLPERYASGQVSKQTLSWLPSSNLLLHASKTAFPI
jgi:hypothetical protein